MEASSSREPVGGETAQARTAEASRGATITADPGPLGLAAFALTTFVLSMFNAHLVSQKGIPVVLGLALAYGGIAQLLAGMWEFRTGNTFGATAFTSFGAFWISFWAFEQFYAEKITDPKVKAHAVALFLIAWGIFTAYMFIASLRTTAAVSLVFLLLAATFFVLGVGDANVSENTTKIGGYLGLATAAAAWYASFAAVANSTFGRVIMPVVDLRNRGRRT
ncbi:MAG: acetate uptake transporter [Thermoleophilaceae bacterium]